jgi:hypothetical protein
VYDVAFPGERRRAVPEDNRWLWIDCKKIRVVTDSWTGRKKSLGTTSALDSLTGKADGVLRDFKQVRRPRLQKFADGCGKPIEAFFADPVDLARWRADQAPLSNRARRASASGGAVPTSSKILEQMYHRLCGFYELYHYATSKRETPKVSVCLVHINEFDPVKSVIKCELHDNSQTKRFFHLFGHVSEVGGFLDWALGLSADFVICHGYSYLPTGEKNPGSTIYGVFLALSGDEKFDYPVAARGVLRFLGETAVEAIRNSVVDLKVADEQPEKLLMTCVGGYLDDLKHRKLLRPEVLKRLEKTILPQIKNFIPANAAPRALIAPR